MNHLDERMFLDDMVLSAFPHIKPLTPTAQADINGFKDGSFARSLLGFMLYCNGNNLRSRSIRCPNGLYFCDGTTLFGLGFFRKTMESRTWHPMIIAPSGSAYVDKIEEVITTVTKIITRSSDAPELGCSFVRHLTADQLHLLRTFGYQDISASPWHPDAPSEDETHNHRRICIDHIIGTNDSGFYVKILDSDDNRGFRVKSRRAYDRFENFLHRNQLQLEIEPYTPEHEPIGYALVHRHFHSLKNPIGSTPEDYHSIVSCFPSTETDQYYGRIGFVISQNKRIPAMLFIGEKTDPTTVSLYATFALRDPTILEHDYDTTGYSAISQYCYLRIFQDLSNLGIQYADLGGSETLELDTFKRQLGAQRVDSYWAVKSVQE